MAPPSPPCTGPWGLPPPPSSLLPVLAPEPRDSQRRGLVVWSASGFSVHVQHPEPWPLARVLPWRLPGPCAPAPAGKAVGGGEGAPRSPSLGPRGPAVHRASPGSHVTPVRPPPGRSRVQHCRLLSSASFLQCLSSSDCPERKTTLGGAFDFKLLITSLKQLSLSQKWLFQALLFDVTPPHP